MPVVYDLISRRQGLSGGLPISTATVSCDNLDLRLQNQPSLGGRRFPVGLRCEREMANQAIQTGCPANHGTEHATTEPLDENPSSAMVGAPDEASDPTDRQACRREDDYFSDQRIGRSLFGIVWFQKFAGRSSSRSAKSSSTSGPASFSAATTTPSACKASTPSASHYPSTQVAKPQNHSARRASLVPGFPWTALRHCESQ